MAKDLCEDYFFGKNAFITGGSSGIGLALARQLVSRGGGVWLAARNKAKLESACQELKDAAVNPGQVIGFSQADVSVEAQSRAAVEQAQRELGPLDLVFNNAGVTYPGYFQDLSGDIFHQMMDINYYGTLKIINHRMYSNYNSLQVSWNKQAGAFNFLANYTWSKALGIRGENGAATGDPTDLNGTPVLDLKPAVTTLENHDSRNAHDTESL